MIIHVSESKQIVDKPSHIFTLVSEYFKTIDKVDQDKEHFFAFHLDTRNKIKVFELVSIGILNTSLVHPREVFTRAVMLRSAQIIIAHNHPSGEAKPSDEDLELTRRLRDAGKVLGIEVIDHVVCTKYKFFSLKEHGLI